MLEQVRTREYRRRYPANPAQPHWIPASVAAVGEFTLEIRRESVRTLSHSCSSNPCDSNSAVIRAEFHPRISSRIGISTLKASSLRMVRRAIGVIYLFS